MNLLRMVCWDGGEERPCGAVCCRFPRVEAGDVSFVSLVGRSSWQNGPVEAPNRPLVLFRELSLSGEAADSLVHAPLRSV